MSDHDKECCGGQGRHHHQRDHKGHGDHKGCCGEGGGSGGRGHHNRRQGVTPAERKSELQSCIARLEERLEGAREELARIE